MSEWKPIATAPKDGREFLAFISGNGQDFDRCAVLFWKGSYFAEYAWDSQAHAPTHWMPLPAKPGGQGMSDNTKGLKNMKPVIVRTYSAGVHFGYLAHHEGREVRLERSRRIWSWAGANTLSEIATSGLDVKNSRVAVPVTIVLTEAIEIIDCTPEAVACLEAAIWRR